MKLEPKSSDGSAELGTTTPTGPCHTSPSSWFAKEVACGRQEAVGNLKQQPHAKQGATVKLNSEQSSQEPHVQSHMWTRP